MARRCLDARIRGFAEFEGFCTDRFRPGTQSFKSAMFTNFITPARGRTRFYHCSRPRSSFVPSRIARPATRCDGNLPSSIPAGGTSLHATASMFAGTIGRALDRMRLTSAK
ncbi:hypothetical protein CFB41_06225 [Burkholderia sp. AU33803]|nr:hypothetical protein CFB41_06225 [Burkholderia sp. AU33803]PRD86644.1 hypothetical protein C6P88_31170 [Burkholderia contaminans]